MDEDEDESGEIDVSGSYKSGEKEEGESWFEEEIDEDIKLVEGRDEDDWKDEDEDEGGDEEEGWDEDDGGDEDEGEDEDDGGDEDEEEDEERVDWEELNMRSKKFDQKHG